MLRYTNIEEAIRLARSAGMSTLQIVRALSGSVPHSEALQIARKAAPFWEFRESVYGASSESLIVYSDFSRSIIAALKPCRASSS